MSVSHSPHGTMRSICDRNSFFFVRTCANSSLRPDRLTCLSMPIFYHTCLYSASFLCGIALKQWKCSLCLYAKRQDESNPLEGKKIMPAQDSLPSRHRLFIFSLHNQAKSNRHRSLACPIEMHLVHSLRQLW